MLSGIDNPAARLPGPGNGHHNSMSGLVSGEMFSGRGAGGPSIDQAIAQQIGNDSRFRSLQIGVCQESFGESIQRNMSWAGRDRPLPPEMIPHRLFDRLFGSREQYWIERKKSILDAVSDEARSLKSALGHGDQQRLEEYLTSVRSLERSVASLPPEYAQVVEQPPEGGDLKDWPRIAKLQTDLLVHALASRQTRVASYMLTKCQGLSRFPWLGYTYERHHEYTHGQVETPARPADHAGHLPLARRGVRLLPRQAQVDPGGRWHAARPHLCALRPRACRSQFAQERRPGHDRRGACGQAENRAAHAA